MHCFKPIIKKSSTYIPIMHIILLPIIFLKIYGSDDN